MIGYDGDDDQPSAASGLLPPTFRPSVGALLPSTAHKLAAAAVLALVVPLLWLHSSGSPSATVLASAELQAPGAPAWPAVAHGVSLGGWLVMEINPSHRTPTSPLDLRPQWMYDQIEAASELDFVSDLRREHGDAYAIATMKNHWAGYYTGEMLDEAKALGVDAVRVPVGYWIVDAPVGGSSPLEYGISPEGFVTGGLNHLRTMLEELKRRGMVALLDLHSMPCNSACVSDGMYCAAALAFAPAGAAPIGDIARCGGGTYPTARTPTAGLATWGDVGVAAVAQLAAWVAALPAEAAAVAALQLANEPALSADAGLGGPDLVKEAAVNAWYAAALAAARAHLPALPLVLSFIPPSAGVMAFLQQARAEHAPLLADHHYYLNFQQADHPSAADPMCCMPWAEIHRRACTARTQTSIGWQTYVAASQPLVIGEWSLAVNHDAPQDLTDAHTRRELTRLFQEQLEAFQSSPGFRGSFFWTLRMGSGWDPRPSAGHPHGRQLAGSSGWRSLAGYPYAVWSLLELSAAGVATPLNLSYTACAAGMAYVG